MNNESLRGQTLIDLHIINRSINKLRDRQKKILNDSQLADDATMQGCILTLGFIIRGCIDTMESLNSSENDDDRTIN